jgi:hypothetical protein
MQSTLSVAGIHKRTLRVPQIANNVIKASLSITDNIIPWKNKRVIYTTTCEGNSIVSIDSEHLKLGV